MLSLLLFDPQNPKYLSDPWSRPEPVANVDCMITVSALDMDFALNLHDNHTKCACLLPPFHRGGDEDPECLSTWLGSGRSAQALSSQVLGPCLLNC